MTQEVPFKEGVPIPAEFQLGVYTPEGRLSNEEIESWQVTKPKGGVLTAEGIYKTVGVSSRSIAHPTETTHDMLNAALTDLEYRNNVNFTDPDVVIVSSSFPTGINHARRFMDEWQFPATTVHQDIHAACSGFVKGLVGLYEEGDKWNGADVLMAATEKYSPYVHDLRKGYEGDPALSQTIFSDGAAAVRFRYGRDLKVLAGENVRMFEKSALIGMPIRGEDIVGPADREVADATTKTPEIYQNGPFILRNMADTIPGFVRRLARQAGLPQDEEVLTILHQGSRRTFDNIAEKLEPEDDGPVFAVRYDLEDGNFSSVTIPRMLAKEQLVRGQRAILVGFGAGLFASGVVVEFG